MSTTEIGFVTQIFRDACVTGNLALAQKYCEAPRLAYVVFSETCTNNQLPVAKWLLATEGSWQCNDILFITVCGKGHREVAEWLLTIGGNRIDGYVSYALQRAFSSRHIHMIKWLVTINPENDVGLLHEALKLACVLLNSELVQWLAQTMDVSSGITDAAKQQPNFWDIVPRPSLSLEADVEFFLVHDACDAWTHVVTYVMRSRSVNPDSDMQVLNRVEAAVPRDEVVRFCRDTLDRCTSSLDESSCLDACLRKPSVFQWICGMAGYRLLDLAAESVTCVFLRAAHFGNLTLVKWISVNSGVPISANVMSEAFWRFCYNGNLDAAKWLLATCPTLDIHFQHERAFRSACGSGHLHVAKWLLEVAPDIAIDTCRNHAFCGACKGYHVHVADWLLTMNPTLNAGEILSAFGYEFFPFAWDENVEICAPMALWLESRMQEDTNDRALRVRAVCERTRFRGLRQAWITVVIGYAAGRT